METQNKRILNKEEGKIEEYNSDGKLIAEYFIDRDLLDTNVPIEELIDYYCEQEQVYKYDEQGRVKEKIDYYQGNEDYHTLYAYKENSNLEIEFSPEHYISGLLIKEHTDGNYVPFYINGSIASDNIAYSYLPRDDGKSYTLDEGAINILESYGVSLQDLETIFGLKSEDINIIPEIDRTEYKEVLKEIEEKIKNRIEQSKELVYPERRETLKKKIIELSQTIKEKSVDIAFNMMSEMNNLTNFGQEEFEKIDRIFENNAKEVNDEYGYNIELGEVVNNMVLWYAKKYGPEYYEMIISKERGYYGDPEGAKKTLEEIRKENAELWEKYEIKSHDISEIEEVVSDRRKENVNDITRIIHNQVGNNEIEKDDSAINHD